MTIVKRIGKNFLALTIGSLTASGMGFAATVYLARSLGVRNFGEVIFAQTILIYFMLFTNLGLNTFGIREISRDNRKINIYVNNILTLRVILSMVSFILLVLLTILIPKPQHIKNLILLFGLSLFPFALFLDWPFQGIEKMEYVAISRIIDKAVYVILIFSLVKNSQQLVLIPFFWLSGLVCACSFIAVIYLKQFGMIVPEFKLPLWKNFLKHSIPMGAGFIIMQIYYHFDTIMLGFMKGEKEVGWYNAAYKIIYFIIAIGGLYFVAIFPIISKLYKKSREKLKILLSYSLKLMVTITLPLAIGGTIIAKPLMIFFYGREYYSGVIVFQILIWTVAIFFISFTYSYFLLACDRGKEYLIGISIGTLVNIVLNVVLIPYFNLIGASFATAIGALVIFFYMYFRSRKVIKISFMSYIFKPLIAATSMGLVLYFSKITNLFLLMFLGVLIFISVMLLSRGITRNEIKMLKDQLFRKS